MTTAKKKIAPPRPDPSRPWSELTKHEQNSLFSSALHEYTQGRGENPKSFFQYETQRKADEAKGK
ncbi:MAG: hypothetical protein M3N19_05890 [Candidatus Eremiobacteraeota bacterium]|nr:hypothetical protein [Candidatus Eremiobacteraeota bacterium]